jgi:anti-sigma factor RsiW
MKINIYYLVGFIILAAFLIGMLFVRGCDNRRMKRTGNHSRKASSVQIPVLDTVRVPVIEPNAPKAPVVVPVLTKVQSKPDLPRRRQAEKQTIITGIRKTADSLYIQTISPKGIVMENSFPEVYATGKFEIDSTGNLRIDPAEFAATQRRAQRKERWKKIWRTTKTVVVSGIVGLAAFQLGKSL